MEEISTLQNGKMKKAIGSIPAFLISLVLYAVLLHPFVFFRNTDSVLSIILLSILWLAFRIVSTCLSDPKGILRGVLRGFEVFLVVEFAINILFLFHIDHKAFAASLYFCAGLFFVFDRLRKMFPLLKQRWPVSSVAVGMTTLLLFGLISSIALIKSPCKNLDPQECKSLGKKASAHETVLNDEA